MSSFDIFFILYVAILFGLSFSNNYKADGVAFSLSTMAVVVGLALDTRTTQQVIFIGMAGLLGGLTLILCLKKMLIRFVREKGE